MHAVGGGAASPARPARILLHESGRVLAEPLTSSCELSSEPIRRRWSRRVKSRRKALPRTRAAANYTRNSLASALLLLSCCLLPCLSYRKRRKRRKSRAITAHELVITADDAGAFEDAETRAFYEVRRLAHPAQRAFAPFRDVRFALRLALPELRSMLPEVLFAEPSKEKANPEDEGAATMFEKTLSRLAHVHSREAADELASELCCHGAAHHRRKLVSVRTLPRAWVSQKRPRLSLTPCCRHLLPRRGSVQSTFPTMAGLRLRRVRRSVMWALSSWLRCARSSTPTSTAVMACSRREPCPAHGSLIRHAFPAASCCTRVVAGRRGCACSVYGRTPEVRARCAPAAFFGALHPQPDTPTRIPHAPPSAVQMPSSAYLMPSRCSTPRWCASFWRPRGAFCTARLTRSSAVCSCSRSSSGFAR